MMTGSERIDKESFLQIFSKNWEGFKESHPSYNTAQYEDVVQKMLRCGKCYLQRYYRQKRRKKIELK